MHCTNTQRGGVKIRDEKEEERIEHEGPAHAVMRRTSNYKNTKSKTTHLNDNGSFDVHDHLLPHHLLRSRLPLLLNQIIHVSCRTRSLGRAKTGRSSWCGARCNDLSLIEVQVGRVKMRGRGRGPCPVPRGRFSAQQKTRMSPYHTTYLAVDFFDAPRAKPEAERLDFIDFERDVEPPDRAERPERGVRVAEVVLIFLLFFNSASSILHVHSTRVQSGNIPVDFTWITW